MWTEEMIREEMRRLDEKTGLHGSELPIRFGQARSMVGCFVLKDGKPECFRFSRYYFDNPDFAHGSAMDAIVHEYAHYMDFCRRGTSGHGPEWKACCEELGGELPRCFDPLVNLICLLIERHEPIEKAFDMELPFENIRGDMPKRKKAAAHTKDCDDAAA